MRILILGFCLSFATGAMGEYYKIQCWDSYSSFVTSYILLITSEKSNAIRYILLYFLKKCNIITVTYYILLFRTLSIKKRFFVLCNPYKLIFFFFRTK